MEFTHAIVRLLDYPLGWMLALPRDIVILLVALLTSLVLTLIRKYTTNQDRLKRCKQDLVRLKSLSNEHKAAGDKEALARTRATGTAVKLIQMKAEGLGLLVSLIPIGALALWAVERLDYLPARTGEEILITARFAPSAIDSVTHLVPVDGLTLNSPAVQIVAADPENAGQGIATWRVVAVDRAVGNALRGVPADAGPPASISNLESEISNAKNAQATLELLIRHQKQTAHHKLLVGGRYYDPPQAFHQGGAIEATEVGLRQAKLLGLVPGIPWLGLAPWLVAYLLLAIPLTPVVRYILRVS